MDEMRRDDDNALIKADHTNEDVDNSNTSDARDNKDVPSSTAAISTITSQNTPAPESAEPSSAQLHANLWNTFLKTISHQHQYSGECKYPNPDVPEFYPRNTISYFNACANSSDQTITVSPTKCIAYNKTIMPKNQLVSMSQQCFAAATTTTTTSSSSSSSTTMTTTSTDVTNLKNIVNPSRELVHGVSHYYWTVRDTSHYWLPRAGVVTSHKSDQLRMQPAAPATVSDHRFQSELNKKDKQLVHLNNVVKALIEEIWRINELLTTYKNKDELKNDLTFAIDELLKPSSELGFHCDDCCDKFKHFVVKIFRQQERKIAKQQAHNKDTLVNYIVSVIDHSLRAFSQGGHVKCDFKATLRPTRTDVATQTDQASQEDHRRPHRRPDSRRSKHQATKIYRNRNYYKVYDVHGAPASTLDAGNWYPATMPSSSFIGSSQTQNNRNRNRHSKSIKHSQPKSSYLYKTTSTAAAIQPPSLFESQPTNPIQLIHQKYKNLNCRLEGIPDKNLVKFSYIVNGKEYSAIASTKKEAQYHCAWHVLGSTKHK